MNNFKPIFITGIERSGSSIIARIVEICGAFAGNTTDMWENRGIKNLVDRYYVQQLGIPSNGQKPLPNTKDLIIPPLWDRQVKDMIWKDQYCDDRPWMYKNCRLSQIWPVWHSAFPQARWIIVRRRTGDIIQSCLKTGFMKAYTDQTGWLEWVHYHENLFLEMFEAELNCKVIWPERMAYGDFQQMQELIEWLGLEWNVGINHMIETLLKNSSQKERSNL